MICMLVVNCRNSVSVLVCGNLKDLAFYKCLTWNFLLDGGRSDFLNGYNNNKANLGTTMPMSSMNEGGQNTNKMQGMGGGSLDNWALAHQHLEGNMSMIGSANESLTPSQLLPLPQTNGANNNTNNGSSMRM